MVDWIFLDDGTGGQAPAPATRTLNGRHDVSEVEWTLRRRLGIPDDARQVIVFAESSHWDPNWLRTSEEYFMLVRRNLDQALRELAREPRRVYSVECMFFLRMYWERCPEQREAVRALINDGRLRLTSSGVTTADTLLPHPEAILRDLLLGQEWLRTNGMTQEPSLAYFADSFGCSPALPSLLRAAGFARTAITRVDGMKFMGADYETSRHFPRAGSSAALLLEGERTLDFVWQGPDGAEVLAHWNAFTYGQGDMLAHRGLTRMYLAPIAVPARSDGRIARRVGGWARQLTAYSRTPYLFCPIGMDFVAPIPGLVELLDRYNTRHYPHSGVWAVNAGLDDYLALVDCYRSWLPVLRLDPNPYWTGFYTSRPSLKRRCHDLVDNLLLAERLAVVAGGEADRVVRDELAGAWWTAAAANHHDMITGTSPDRVVVAEQLPWLEQASAAVRAAVTRLGLPPPPVTAPAVPPTAGGDAAVEWSRHGRSIRVQTRHYGVELSECAGGAIIRAWDPASGALLLADPSNELVSYRDAGGLWRMGHEFLGGSLRQSARSGRRQVAVNAEERNGGLETSSEVVLEGETVRSRAWFAPDLPFICFRVEGRAAERRTITAQFETGLAADRLTMDAPGGLVSRPRSKVYEPAFWPFQHLLVVPGGENAGRPGLALILARPGAAALHPDGRLEVVALRNATIERAYGVLPFPGTAAVGHEREATGFDFCLAPTCGDEREGLALLPRAMAAMAAAWAPPDPVRALAAGAVQTDRPDVEAVTCKAASRGQGIIVRLYTLSPERQPVAVCLPGRSAAAGWLCDARERDLAPLEVHDGAVHLTMPGTVATVRMIL